MTQVTEASAETSSATLGQEVGELLGDYQTPDVETPESEDASAAGTTPAEPATETADEDLSTDGATAAESDGTTPDTPTVTASDEADPFADTTPLTFTVNGQQLTNEGIRVFKEGGAVIRPEAVADIQNRLSERESLFERNRAQSQEYQTLSKVLEWHDPSSNKTYTGPEAAIEMRIGNAALLAENQLLVEYLTDPDKLYSILATEQVPDGNGGMRERIVLSPDALKSLQTQNELRQLKSAQALRTHFSGILSQASQPQAAPVNYERVTPELVNQIATASKLDASVLTASDKALLAKQLPFHIKDGQASVEWQELVKDRIQERTSQKANVQSVVSATEKATREGAARMAAAARGVRPARRPTAPVKPTTPENTKTQSEADLWDLTERASARAMRQR